MKISELNLDQCKKIAKNNPKWMGDNHHTDIVPDDILKIILEK